MKAEIYYTKMYGIEDRDKDYWKMMEISEGTRKPNLEFYEKKMEMDVERDGIAVAEEVFGNLQRGGPDQDYEVREEMDKKEMRSMSSGDMVKIDGTFYVAELVGWSQYDASEVNR